MTFFIYLAVVNIICFLPLYLLNFKEQPNPFEFLFDKRNYNNSKLKILYAKHPYTDPFHVNFEYTFFLLLAAGLNWSSTSVAAIAATLWTFGIINVAYSSVMRFIFMRPPSLRSDLSLARSGWSIVYHSRLIYIAGIILTVSALLVFSYLVTYRILQVAAGGSIFYIGLAVGLAVPGLYNWRGFSHTYFLSRTVYSPILHFYRNLIHSNKFTSIESLGTEHFESLNFYKGIVLADKPNVITICVESYGSLVFENEQVYEAIHDVLQSYSGKLAQLGYHIASNFSEPPLFAGGSWLSYVSFTYGAKVDDLSMFDALFSERSSLPVYESLFHVLKRNGYRNYLLCPLGGFEDAAVDWERLNRCFQSDRNYDFESVRYQGQTYRFMAHRKTFFPPDQYSLNFAYDDIMQSDDGPFSLFYCTLNSHYPWDSPQFAVDDWRELNRPANHSDGDFEPGDRGSRLARYGTAIRYQLEYILKFIVDHPSDDLVVTLFGDHQAPFITPEALGKQTPVHVISRHGDFVEGFQRHGFVAGLDLARERPEGMKHEGFLSLFMQRMNQSFGQDRELQIKIKERGVDLFGSKDE